MARRRFAHLNQTGKVAHTQLASVQQGVDDPQSAGVGQKLETFGQELSIVKVEDTTWKRAMTMLRGGFGLDHGQTLFRTTYEYKLRYSDVGASWRSAHNRQMKESTFRLERMDCDAEEQLVRMALDDVDGINGTRFDLDERTVTVWHETDTSVVADTLDALDLNMTPLSGYAARVGPDEANERRVLTFALVINATLFVGELVAGLLSRSMGLLADSLDMLADTSVYSLSLVAVGGTAHRKKRLAATSGYLQLGLAFFGLFEVARRFIVREEAPDALTMIVVSLIALSGNVATMLTLRRARSPEAHFQASWIFTANDIKVNGLVILSAVIVAITDNATADLIAGAAIFIIVANGARRILKLARP